MVSAAMPLGPVGAMLRQDVSIVATLPKVNADVDASVVVGVSNISGDIIKTGVIAIAIADVGTTACSSTLLVVGCVFGRLRMDGVTSGSGSSRSGRSSSRV